MDIGQVFDEIQEQYTQKMIRWVPHYQELIHLLASSFPADFSPKKVLDLGSGNGNITATLLPVFNNAQFILLDASTRMLEEAQKRFSEYSFQYQQGMMQEAHFENASIDLITASFSLHHLAGQQKKSIIAAAYGWLAPGGYFSYADLFVNKSDPEHETFLETWRQFVINHGIDGDWEYLSDHYHRYDFPDNLVTQLQWLRALHFREIRLVILDQYWVYIGARK